MSRSWTCPLEWVARFSSRVRSFVHDEAPECLIEFEVDGDECAELLRQVGRLPLQQVATSESRPAVAVAAVQAAANAQQGEDAFRPYFFECLHQPVSLHDWEWHYGPAIEAFLNEAFGEPPRSGPWRYVYAVYRHAGIPLPGIHAYAHFLAA